MPGATRQRAARRLLISDREYRKAYQARRAPHRAVASDGGPRPPTFRRACCCGGSSRLVPRELCWLTHRGIPESRRLIQIGSEDSRHAFGGEIARELFGRGARAVAEGPRRSAAGPDGPRVEAVFRAAAPHSYREAIPGWLRVSGARTRRDHHLRVAGNRRLDAWACSPASAS
jgi:hypothetical protein